MNTNEKYADLLQQARDTGDVIHSRNSIVRRISGTRRVFTSTPLVSARKTAWKLALKEFEWMLSGSTDINDLHPSVRHWWEPFCTLDGKTLVYGYGHALRNTYLPASTEVVEIEAKTLDEDEPIPVPNFPLRAVEEGKHELLGYTGTNFHGDSFTVIDYVGAGKYLVQFKSNGFCVESLPTNFKKGTIKNPYYPTVCGAACVGVPNQVVAYRKRAFSIWSGLVNRCYNPNRQNYKFYGGRGVKVSGRWRCFEFFLEDLPKVIGFENWLQSPDEYNLDKDYHRANYYSPETCVFLSRRENISLSNKERYAKAPRRKLVLDQVQELIDGITNDPFSRRNVITTWLPAHVHSGLMNPTNCHGTVIQCLVSPDAELELITYQRSADLVCGLPHNWIQYWAFLMWLAHRTGTKVGRMIWVGGDVHLYDAHIDLADKIIAATPSAGEAPELVYTPTTEEFRADDFTLSCDYQPLITEKAEMIA